MTWTQPLPFCYDETCPRELIAEVQETVLVFFKGETKGQ